MHICHSLPHLGGTTQQYLDTGPPSCTTPQQLTIYVQWDFKNDVTQLVGISKYLHDTMVGGVGKTAILLDLGGLILQRIWVTSFMNDPIRIQLKQHSKIYFRAGLDFRHSTTSPLLSSQQQQHQHQQLQQQSGPNSRPGTLQRSVHFESPIHVSSST